MYVYQHQRADNDPNGNPQRLWRVWRVRSEGDATWSDTVAIVDEGYGDFPRDTFPGAVELTPVRIPRSAYHAAIRWARDAGVLTRR
jgi:hypothetical protein